MPQGGAGFMVGTSAIPPHQRHSQDGPMLDLDKAIKDGDLAEFNALIDSLFLCDSREARSES
jgi:hypothetical protein